MSIELFTLTSRLSLTYKLGRYKTTNFSLYRCLFRRQSDTVYPNCASPFPQRSHPCTAIGGSSINNHVPFSGEVFYKPCVALCWEWIQENQISRLFALRQTSVQLQRFPRLPVNTDLKKLKWVSTIWYMRIIHLLISFDTAGTF